LRPLLQQERELLLLDAKINERGIRANVPFLQAVRAFAIEERNAINIRLNELTAGVITSVDQVARIKAAVNGCAHAMNSLSKRSVAATLAHQPKGVVRELLELRQRGAYASVWMAKRLLAHADPGDGRIRGALRIYGAGPGRWSSPGPQLHNLRRNDAEYPANLVDALIAGDRAELARYGNPLGVAAQLSRAALCAAPGHTLICADLSAIESRVLAWLAGERWKLNAYAQYDATGDKTLEPYRVVAARMLHKEIATITSAERQQGKAAELAAGFGGSVGAWRRIAGDDGRTDAEVLAIIRQWRAAHPGIRKFWADLARAAGVAIRTRQPITVGTAPRPQIIAAFDGHALTLALTSGRAINYPGAYLVPNPKFEGADPDIEFFDNARGQWQRTRAWFGTLVENVVQGTARDLLAAAMPRFESRELPVVFHCHDEIVVEVPEGSISESEVLAILLEPPSWASGLPLGGKVHTGALYLDAPETGEPPPPKTEPQPAAHEAQASHPRATAPGASTADLGAGNMSDAAPVVEYPTIDPTEADRFLSIFGTNVFTFQTFDDNPSRKDRTLAQIFHGTREQVHAQLVELQCRGAGVFVTLNETDGRGRRTQNIIRVRAYAFDTDGAPLQNGERLGLLPTAIIESSPGRYWVVYLIDDAPLDATNFKRTQKQLAQLMESDESVCDLPRVMRLPGFLHQKNPDRPFMSRIQYLNI
jgi:DNA polymerase